MQEVAAVAAAVEVEVEVEAAVEVRRLEQVEAVEVVVVEREGEVEAVEGEVDALKCEWSDEEEVAAEAVAQGTVLEYQLPMRQQEVSSMDQVVEVMDKLVGRSDADWMPG